MRFPTTIIVLTSVLLLAALSLLGGGQVVNPVDVTIRCNLAPPSRCDRLLQAVAQAYNFRPDVDGPDTAAGRRAFIEGKLTDQLVTTGAGIESTLDADTARETKRKEFEGQFARPTPTATPTPPPTPTPRSIRSPRVRRVP